MVQTGSLPGILQWVLALAEETVMQNCRVLESDSSQEPTADRREGHYKIGLDERTTVIWTRREEEK